MCDRVTIEEAEHMLATRLWQNTAKVHFDVTQREDGRRLIYGGHVISLARALSFNGLANAQVVGGDQRRGACQSLLCRATPSAAWSEVLDKAETAAPGVGALRLRTVAVKAGAPEFALRDEAGKYLPEVLLDLDYWVLVPCLRLRSHAPVTMAVCCRLVRDRVPEPPCIGGGGVHRPARPMPGGMRR